MVAKEIMALPTENAPTETGRRADVHPVFLLLAFLLLGSLSAGQEGKSEPPQTLPTLKTIREVRELPSEKARLGYPIRVRAVVTYGDRMHGDFFVQDSTAGIYVSVGQATIDLHSGQYVEIDGISGPGDFASEIVNPQIQILRQAVLPAPRKVSGEVFVTGFEDSQYVEVEGIVRSAVEDEGRLLLHVASGTAIIPAFVLDHTPIPQNLVGAKVRLQGVSGGLIIPGTSILAPPC